MSYDSSNLEIRKGYKTGFRRAGHKYCTLANSDQLLNKRDDLLMKIADSPPDIILITEVIPKAQTNPTIEEARLNILGFNIFLNFDPNLYDLEELSWCCNLFIQQDKCYRTTI